jgi:hypothetical protein
MANQMSNHANNVYNNYSRKEISSFKKALKNKLYSSLNFYEINNDNNKLSFEDGEKDREYFFRYTSYINHEFNSNIVNMIVLYINDSNSFTKKYKEEPNFILNMINLIKSLFMNEIEVAYYTIALEKIGVNYKDIEHWLYFSILGVATKKLCGKEEDCFLLINKLSKKNQKFIDEYSAFINDNKIIAQISNNQISLQQINQRFILLSKPINTYCRKNYLNFQGIIDNIVKLSQPYYKDILNQKKANNKKLKKKKFIIKTNKTNEIEKKENTQPYHEPDKTVDFENCLSNFNNKQNFEYINHLEYNHLNGIMDTEENNFTNQNLNLWNLDSLSFSNSNNN